MTPLFLSEIAPVKIRGSVGTLFPLRPLNQTNISHFEKGVLTQLSICFGLTIAQGISIPLSTPQTGNWRIIPLISASLAVVQILLSKSMIESPFWLAEQRKNRGRVFDIPDDEEDEVIRHVDDEEAGESFNREEGKKVLILILTCFRFGRSFNFEKSS